jgi:hypothetical protein
MRLALFERTLLLLRLAAGTLGFFTAFARAAELGGKQRENRADDKRGERKTSRAATCRTVKQIDNIIQALHFSLSFFSLLWD